MFIATGQDVADISESQAAVTYSQLLENGDYYWSVTLTSLIVGTVGGGTGLATQRECLEMLGCHGQGKADKFAECSRAWRSPANVAGKRSAERRLVCPVMNGWDGATRRSHPQLDRAKDPASSRGVFAAVQPKASEAGHIAGRDAAVAMSSPVTLPATDGSFYGTKLFISRSAVLFDLGYFVSIVSLGFGE